MAHDRQTAWGWIPLAPTAVDGAVPALRRLADGDRNAPSLGIGAPRRGVGGFVRSHELAEDARARLRSSWAKRGATDAELGWTDSVLDPDVLTIGFARRVPTYKRLTLMLRDPERLKALLLHPERPVQLVIAGKSHPADETGKQLIQHI